MSTAEAPTLRQASIPMAGVAPSRVIGLSVISDAEMRNAWYVKTGAHRNTPMTATPEKLLEVKHEKQAERETWYAIGRDESIQRFAGHDDNHVILNFWHFSQRSRLVHSAYEQGVRDAFATIADRRGLTIPEVSSLTKAQRCVCGACATYHGWEPTS